MHLEDLLANHFVNGGKRIKKLPDNLIVRIKRVHEIAGVEEKITDEIIVPETINLRPYCAQNIQNTRTSFFKLESFIEHCGTCTSGGHYLFYLHHKSDGKYYAISDENVKELTRREYLDKAAKAYLLMFQPEQ